MTEKIKEMMQKSKTYLNEAIISKDPEKWNLHIKKNQVTRELNLAKKTHTITQFNHVRDKWRLVKNINNQNKSPPPSSINFINSPKEIAEIANHFFKDKIEKIRKNFSKADIDPIEFLGELISKPK